MIINFVPCGSEVISLVAMAAGKPKSGDYDYTQLLTSVYTNCLRVM